MIFSKSKIIRVRQTASTNSYLLQLSNAEKLAEGTVVVTNHQTQGRGQAENTWESEPGANLTFSIILYPSSVGVARQFMVSKAISLAVYDFVSQYVPNVSIKWPNDIYVGERKITGILIENFVEGAYLCKTIAGIGVNINQERFLSDAPNPVSLRQLTGKTYSLENCLKDLQTQIATRYRMIPEDTHRLDSDYLLHLYRYGKVCRYKANGVLFNATITGVNYYGMLEMIAESGEYRIFGYKEVEYILL